MDKIFKCELENFLLFHELDFISRTHLEHGVICFKVDDEVLEKIKGQLDEKSSVYHVVTVPISKEYMDIYNQRMKAIEENRTKNLEIRQKRIDERKIIKQAEKKEKIPVNTVDTDRWECLRMRMVDKKTMIIKNLRPSSIKVVTKEEIKYEENKDEISVEELESLKERLRAVESELLMERERNKKIKILEDEIRALKDDHNQKIIDYVTLKRRTVEQLKDELVAETNKTKDLERVNQKLKEDNKELITNLMSLKTELSESLEKNIVLCDDLYKTHNCIDKGFFLKVKRPVSDIIGNRISYPLEEIVKLYDDLDHG